jgi:hypothetical protein
VIFFEGFEGLFPGGVWNVGDSNSYRGYDYWDDVSCRSRTGSWSGWCSAIGDMPYCQYYDWYMVAYMHTSDGIDLTNYTNVYLNYSVWYETEDYDYIAILYSPDGRVAHSLLWERS